jgi:hypothetical protein
MATGTFDSNNNQAAVTATNSGGGDAILAVVGQGNGIGIIADGNGAAVSAVQSGQGLAGSFTGDVDVSGDFNAAGAATFGGNLTGVTAAFTTAGAQVAILGSNPSTGDAILGIAAQGNAVAAIANGAGAAVSAVQTGTGLAGSFTGDVTITGTLSVGVDIILQSADCAEDFDIQIGVDAEPGTVMVLDRDGRLVESSKPYDSKVVGVISGAGDFRPALILDKRDSELERRPVALMGKVFCKVDAGYGGIEAGDLLTTSATVGHAMKAEANRASGSIIGKALRPMASGRGLLPMLVAPQ